MLQPIEQAIQDLKDGKFIVLVDDEDRENEGDLVIAGEFATSINLNTIINKARGMMCVPAAPEILERLDIPLMIEDSDDPFNTPFTVTIDAKENTSTGISVSDRAETIKLLCDPNSKPDDFVRPGHVLPLKARKEGVKERQGHTEAAVDLCKLAGLKPVAVIAEIMKDDGEMAKMPELKEFSEINKISMYSIQDLVEF